MKSICLGALIFFVAAGAHAQSWEPELNPNKKFESAERFGLELKGGSYNPAVGGSVWDNNISDSGPLLGLEFDVYPMRIPYFGLLGLGFGLGYANFAGSSLNPAGVAISEKTSLNVVPLSVMAVLRVDVLWRELNVPFVFVGKLGGELAFWDMNTGNNNVANGYSGGFRWALQADLYLDFLEPSSARSLDEEWGINHTFLFFELFGTTTGKKPNSNVDLSDTSWAIGLGATF
ncbi:MAG: hypothetical protein IPJ88_12835 [Myxococcales bacterium]|nr:MAG: hypothetical protein IPJ88_12835 [Myxococcales bacterium]